jgi:hypothetical protein
VSELTIGVPAFVLSFRYSSDPCRPGYLSRVLHFAIPAALFAAVATLTTYWLAHGPLGASLEESRTAATMALISAGLLVLARLMQPMTSALIALLAGLTAIAVLAFAIGPVNRFYALELPTTAVMVMTATVVVCCLVVWTLTEPWLRNARWFTA